MYDPVYTVCWIAQYRVADGKRKCFCKQKKLFRIQNQPQNLFPALRIELHIYISKENSLKSILPSATGSIAPHKAGLGSSSVFLSRLELPFHPAAECMSSAGPDCGSVPNCPGLCDPLFGTFPLTGRGEQKDGALWTLVKDRACSGKRPVSCSLTIIAAKRLDLLVRDWQFSGAYGADAGQEYLGEITQDLEVSAEQPLVLEALRASGTRCYLLPHPGTQFTRSRAGTPDDMDEDFRQCLCAYVTSVVHSAGTHVQTDRAGQVLTGAQLAARIKMAEAFAVMRQELNRRAEEATRREYDQFVQELDRDHQSMSSCLRVKPLEMQRRLEGKRQELLERCRGELRGEDPQKQAALKELKKELDKQMAEFLPRYEQRFKMAAMIEEENRKAAEASRRKYEQFVQQLDRDHQSMRRCLSVKPAEMQRRQEGKRQELLERCQGELRGEDPQKQAALEELKKELDKQMDEFLTAYGQRFKMAEMAEMREKANRGAVEAARREYGLFVKQLDRGHQSMSSCLRVKPVEMKRRQEGKRQELLKRCRGGAAGRGPPETGGPGGAEAGAGQADGRVPVGLRAAL
ncbi:uncharacterized protein PHETA2 isoform X3 [Chrysemys picta bellii]|uniref:uncharacterized protein PHETA2 isoform X3 n=1 Tax=Chrysemys picta bellii TaxID=8478 RepID=UPI0032B1041C